MAVHTDSRQRNGLLTIDGLQFACQQRNVRIIPPEAGDEAVEEVLDGTALSGEDSERPWKLGVRSVQDFTNPEGFQKFSWDNAGELVPFTWEPSGATGPTYAGMVQVHELEVGGDVKVRLEVEAEWKLQAKPSWTPAPVAP